MSSIRNIQDSLSKLSVLKSIFNSEKALELYKYEKAKLCKDYAIEDYNLGFPIMLVVKV